MKLYSNHSHLIEECDFRKDKPVTLYTCGPTVYDYPHIGNWYTFIRYDVLNRVLKASGYETKWVINITDVGHLVSDSDDGEDKLEKGAKREGKTAWDIARYYGDYFVKALDRLHFSHIYATPKATDFIAEQIDLVKNLEGKGFTYRISDGMYFDTSLFPEYAEFAHLQLDKLEEGARVEVNPEKKNHSDFAVWKFSEPGVKRDMEWDSPWGKGFPGWHLECSAMIHSVLGEPIDIHGGGIDHIPVHHTNEIAQTVCGYGNELSRYWFHANHIQVDGKKMSKSLGNFYTLEDIENKGFDLEVFRVHVFSGHYRSQSEFSWDVMEATKQRYSNYTAMADRMWQSSTAEINTVQPSEFELSYTLLLEALQNDMNSPEALSVLDNIANQVNTRGVDTKTCEDLRVFLQKVDDIIGTTFSLKPDITDIQKEIIQSRLMARANKEWQKSDELRDQLAAEGINLKDTSIGTVWTRI